jgi:hypothetical protein
MSTESTAHNHRRQPRGIREGGQFAGSKNPESQVVLEGLSETQRVARSLIRRYGLTNRELNGYMSDDDLTQDAALNYLIASDQSADRLVDTPPLRTSLLAKRAIINALQGGDHKGHAALRLFRDEKAELERQLERELTPRERDELAEKLRMSIPSHRRPSVDFHLPKRWNSSLDAATEMNGTHGQGKENTLRTAQAVARAVDSSDDVITDDFAEGSIGDQASILKMEGDQVRARALAWDAIAEFSGAPLTVKGSVGKRVAMAARSAVLEGDGPVGLARTYMDTGRTSDELFVPFGDINDAQRYAVCEIFTKHAEYATELWRVAISQAEGRVVK